MPISAHSFTANFAIVILIILFPLQICFKQAKKWQEAGDACVRHLFIHFVNAASTRCWFTLSSYVKCAEMMLEMKQNHDACNNFLEAAVRSMTSQPVQLLFDALQVCLKKCNIGATVKCYESACRIQV